MIFQKALFGAAAMLGALIFTPADASAGDYCREYTRTVYIGGRSQEAYGTACQQPNGDWMIVDEDLGANIPGNQGRINYVIQDRTNVVVPNRTTYVYPGTTVRTYHYVPRNTVVYYGNPFDRRYYKPKHYDRRDWDRYDRGWRGHDRHDRHDHHGRGRGHDRD
jgi:hypothetical protein